MNPPTLPSAILADRHLTFAEGMRDLLGAIFDTVYVVADVKTLNEAAERLQPACIAVDRSLAGTDLAGTLRTIRESSPATRVILLSVHDEPSIAALALSAGADGIVLKRCAGTEFLPALDAVAHGRSFVSPGFGLLADLPGDGNTARES